jgi:hypothetical protein
MASFEDIIAEGFEAGFRSRGFEPTGRKIENATVSVSARGAAGAVAVVTISRHLLAKNADRNAFVDTVKHHLERAIEAAAA